MSVSGLVTKWTEIKIRGELGPLGSDGIFLPYEDLRPFYKTLLWMATISISPIQVQADGTFYVFEDDEEAGDF